MRNQRSTILTAIGIFILSSIVWQQRNEIIGISGSFNTIYALVSLAMLIVANVFFALTFAYIAEKRNTNSHNIRQFVGVYLASQAAKYVPGKIWSIVMQTLYVRGQVSSAKLVVANLEATLVSIIITAALGFGLLILVKTSSELIGATVFLIGFLAAFLIATSRSLEFLFYMVSDRFRTNKYFKILSIDREFNLCFDYRLLLALMGFIAFYFIGWVMFVGPTLDIDLSITIQWVALMSISYVIGVISMIPAGIGTRELSMLSFADFAGLSPDEAGTIAILSRLMLLSIDIAGTILGGIIIRQKN